VVVVVVVAAVPLRPHPRRQKERIRAQVQSGSPRMNGFDVMWWVQMAAPSPGRALKALSALSQSNLTTYASAGTRTWDEAKASNTMALGLPAGGGNILCSLINHPKPQATQKRKERKQGGG
jgi:hypothetical protein